MDPEQIIKKRAVSSFLSQGILITKDLLDTINGEEEAQETINLVNSQNQQGMAVLSRDVAGLMKEKKAGEVNWYGLEKSKVLDEKNKNTNTYPKFIGYLSSPPKQEEVCAETREKQGVQIIFSYCVGPKKRAVQDFISYYNKRLESLGNILSKRPEMQNMTTISRILNKKYQDNVTFVGMVRDKHITKNNNIKLLLEDVTGVITVIVNKNKPELYEEVKSTVPDEVIGVIGTSRKNVVFANTVRWPDIPVMAPMKRAPTENNAAFLSDLHVGSKNFLEKEFDKFITWVGGGVGNENQRKTAAKIKYIFIAGDIVDGVGVYPGQEEELDIKDIVEQYKVCGEKLAAIPQNIHLIICPGNHDGLRMSEPQPVFYKDLAKPIWDLPNTKIVSNPSVVNIDRSENFSGFNVLMYHGYSFDYYVANVDSIRNQGGYDRADLIMKFLLQRRHLAPAHTSTLFIPDNEKDNLIIDPVPDFFVTGHIHKSSVANYRNITTICGSCWQSTTSFQEKVGHHPEPCRVPIVNLKTRNVKILKFG